MGKLVTVVVCPNCESEMASIADTRFGYFFECCVCRKRVFIATENAHARPMLCCKWSIMCLQYRISICLFSTDQSKIWYRQHLIFCCRLSFWNQNLASNQNPFYALLAQIALNKNLFRKITSWWGRGHLNRGLINILSVFHVISPFFRFFIECVGVSFFESLFQQCPL